MGRALSRMIFRPALFLAASLLAASIGLPEDASAEPQVEVSTRYYTVHGQSGTELMDQMRRKGPRHGFVARAIAQTWYVPKIDAKMEHRDGICRVVDPSIRLKIRYTYPKIGSKVSNALRCKWARFMQGVQEHEKQHGRLAMDLVTELDRELNRFAMRDTTSNCRRAEKTLQNRMKAIWQANDRRQERFDQREHGPGGAVQQMIETLIR